VGVGAWAVGSAVWAVAVWAVVVAVASAAVAAALQAAAPRAVGDAFRANDSAHHGDALAHPDAVPECGA
jgi:hypothetical protein